jgi:hypothetical protein
MTQESSTTRRPRHNRLPQKLRVVKSRLLLRSMFVVDSEVLRNRHLRVAAKPLRQSDDHGRQQNAH